MSDKVPENFDPVVISEQQFDHAVCYIERLKKGLVEFLKQPKRINIVNFPIEMDDGSVQSIQGYRVIHNRVFGPGKGGVRYHPDVTMEEVVSLAKLMTGIHHVLSAWPTFIKARASFPICAPTLFQCVVERHCKSNRKCKACSVRR